MRELRFAKKRLEHLEAAQKRNAPLGRDEEHRAQEDLIRAQLKVRILDQGIRGLNEKLLRGWGGE